MSSTRRTLHLLQHAPQNAMDDPGEIGRFYDACSDLMRALLEALAAAPDRPRPFPEIEDALGWPRRRIASGLGGVSPLRHTEVGRGGPQSLPGGRPPQMGRRELWMDAGQAHAVSAARE